MMVDAHTKNTLVTRKYYIVAMYVLECKFANMSNFCSKILKFASQSHQKLFSSYIFLLLNIQNNITNNI